MDSVKDGIQPSTPLRITEATNSISNKKKTDKFR